MRPNRFLCSNPATPARLSWAHGLVVAGSAVILAGSGWLWGCGSEPGPNPPPPLPPPASVIVSNPIPVALARAPVAALAAGTDVAYVSLEPGAIPTGMEASVRNPRTAGLATAAVVGGGFDPLPVAAEAGDNLDVEVRLADSTSRHWTFIVPSALSPRVVRTYPPHKKRDVALNIGVLVVFTEPISLATLTTSSVELFRGTTPVAGTVGLLQGSATAAVFTPSAPLAANTDYRLVVTQAVQDLTGDALASPVTVDFTTGTGVVGPVVSVRVTPDTVTLPVGSGGQYTVIARDAQNNVVEGRPVTWASSDTLVAKVSATGVVTTFSQGSTTISAQVDGITGSVGLQVSAAAARVWFVNVTPDTVRVDVGGTVNLSAELRDSTGRILYYRLVTWTSSDPAVATVVGGFGGQIAVVTPVAGGTALIVGTIDGKADTSLVSVGPPLPVVGLTLSPNPAATVLQAGVQLQPSSRDGGGFSTQVNPSLVAWSSLDPAVATVNGTGVVTGVSTGSARITGTWSVFWDTVLVNVASLSFTALTAGFYSECGITPSQVTYCWGYPSGAPVAVGGAPAFTSVDAGDYHTCGLASGGLASCWGQNGNGQLGDGTLWERSTPVSVTPARGYASLSVGSYHSCGLTSGGLAYCWGFNSWGQLGTGTVTDSWTSTPVAGGHAFTGLSAGGAHTCGLVSGGAAYCWGFNGYGQLGTGDSLPANVPHLVVNGLQFSGLTAGGDHTCGFLSSGVAYCWGTNDHGQLGTGSTSGFAGPVQVSSGVRFASLSAGFDYTCGLTSAGAAYCWGSNINGQLGNGVSGADQLTPVAVSGGRVFQDLTAGYAHTCGITNAGVAYCWGLNSSGQLGDGTLNNRAVPVKVIGQA